MDMAQLNLVKLWAGKGPLFKDIQLTPVDQRLEKYDETGYTEGGGSRTSEIK